MHVYNIIPFVYDNNKIKFKYNTDIRSKGKIKAILIHNRSLVIKMTPLFQYSLDCY